jgi:hypothetical protein
MKPELRKIHSPDIWDLSNPMVDNEKPFSILIQAMFGSEGGEGADTFDFEVCNALWLKEKAQGGPLSGRHYIVVSHFNIGEITAWLNEIASNISGDTWQEVAEKIGRYGQWEFEDYTPYAPNESAG